MKTSSLCRALLGLCGLTILSALPSQLHAQNSRVILTPEEGYAITWDGNDGGFNKPESDAGPAENAALAELGAIAFGSSEVNLGVHFIQSINDGLYGNNSSWIADFLAAPDADPFIGINFNNRINVQTIAWGRDNGNATDAACGGTCRDRAVGIYTLQYTLLANPDQETTETGDPETGWTSIGTVEYLPGADDVTFSAYLRHYFGVSKGGSPIAATGIRIKVSSNQMAIDEVEVNPPADPVPPLSNFIAITPETGFAISWNGNEGKFHNTAAGASAPENAALVNRGGTAFGSSEFGSGHLINQVNDGLYGNSHSWIPNFATPDPNPFIGIRFAELTPLRRIAWGRDNGDGSEAACGGQCTDRALGLYTLQYTLVDDPGTSTPETGDATSGWVTIGTIHYKAQGQPFTPYLRHSFNLASADGSPLLASAVRIKTPDASTAIDEIEINTNPALEDQLMTITSEEGFDIEWNGNDGLFFDSAEGAAAPPNMALASEGVTPFGSTELDFGTHYIRNINDGLYGNSFSWIADFSNGDADPFIGLNFGRQINLRNIAWGRDNGNSVSDCCGGQLRDRWQGTYTIQVTRTTDPGIETAETGDPSTGWQTLGTVAYSGAAEPEFSPWLRHQFEVSQNANPIAATGLRIKVSSPQLCLDEIEVNIESSGERPELIIQVDGSEALVTWIGNGTLQSTTDFLTWNDLSTQSPQRVALGSGHRFFRVLVK